MSSKTDAALRPSRLPVGSSASTSAGRVTSARATAARCRSPPDSCVRPMIEALPEADALEQMPRACRSACAVRLAPHQQRHRDVLERRELRQQVMELVDEAERCGCASSPRSRVATTRACPAGDAHLPASGRSSPPSKLQQRGLARTGRADDRDALARAHLEFDAAQHFEHRSPCAKLLAQPAASSTRSRHLNSFMSQGLGRRRARGAPRRIERREAAQRERHAAQPAARRAHCTCAGRSLMKYTLASRNWTPSSALESMHAAFGDVRAP